MTGWKGTPGPWRWTAAARPTANGLFHVYVEDEQGHKVAAVWGRAEEKVANVHGMAAVPQMVEAMAEARLLIGEGGQKSELSEAVRQGNLNRAWHLLDDAMRAAKVLP